MLSILLKQPWHAWKSLSLLTKIEVVFLGVTLYAYLSEGLLEWYLSGYTGPFDSTVAFGNALTHAIVVLSMLAAPFILQHRLPQQSAFRIFYTQPLSPLAFIKITAYYYFKYQLFFWAIFGVMITPFFFLNVLSAVFFIFLFLTYHLIFFLMFIYLKTLLPAKRFILSALVVAVVYGAGYLLVTGVAETAWLFDFILIPGSAVLMRFLLPPKRLWALETVFPFESMSQRKRRFGTCSFDSIPRFLPGRLQMLFNKELLTVWRNARFRKLKILTLIVFVILLVLLDDRPGMERSSFALLLAVLAVWLHYNHYFNETYMRAEPAWYIFTLPQRLFSMLAAKFLAEFAYIILLLLVLSGYMVLTGWPWTASWQMLLVLLAFSTLVLFTMLNFQLMFFDDPRMAGYAFNFTVVFLLVMVLNYRFVGPLVGAALIIYFVYRNYKYLNA